MCKIFMAKIPKMPNGQKKKKKDFNKKYVILNSQKNQYLKYYDTPQLNGISIKILTKLFVEFDKLILKIIIKRKGLKRAKKILQAQGSVIFFLR